LGRENGCKAYPCVFSVSGSCGVYSRDPNQRKEKMRFVIAAVLAVVGGPVWADGERAGDFDYYVMSLSWSPNWCAETGDARDDPQCDAGRRLSFTLHGLWPNYETGYPSYCRTTARDPSRGDTAAMADIMGGAGLAFYEWKKHGRCSGLEAREYFALSRRAYKSVVIPDVFKALNRDVELPASVVEDAFIEANPTLERDQITVTCDGGMIEEVRVCLTTDLEPRRCAADVVQDCTLRDAVMEAVR
jgi:ribonuclease T2